MKTIIPMSMLFAVTVAGCTSDPQGDDAAGGGDLGSAAQPVPATAEGTYAMESHFDLATNVPGTAGTITGYIIDATDSPDDPTLFIVQKLTSALPDGSIKNAIASASPFVAGYLNGKLLEVAPTFVTKMLAVAKGFGEVAKDFGVTEVLEIDASGHAVKTIKGLRFTIDGVEQEFAFTDYGIPETRVDGLEVSLAKTGTLAISEHKVPMKYGQVMRLALDQALIPLIDPASANLGQLFKSAVNCTAVGTYVHDALASKGITFVPASTVTAACSAGLAAGANAIYNLMDNIDGAALEFDLTGQARGVDKNRDGKMDEIVTGTWTGGMSYAGTPAPLAETQFFGARM